MKKDFALTNFMLWEKQTNKQTTAPTIMGGAAHQLTTEISWPLRITLVSGTTAMTIKSTQKSIYF